MRRLIISIACIIMCGCGEPESSTLHLTSKRDNGTSSVSRFRVFYTGRIAASSDRSSDGAGISRSVTIDKIADDGVTLTVTLTIYIPDSPAEESKKQVFVPYGKDVTVAHVKDTTLIARVEQKK